MSHRNAALSPTGVGNALKMRPMRRLGFQQSSQQGVVLGANRAAKRSAGARSPSVIRGRRLSSDSTQARW